MGELTLSDEGTAVFADPLRPKYLNEETFTHSHQDEGQQRAAGQRKAPLGLWLCAILFSSDAQLVAHMPGGAAWHVLTVVLPNR